MAYKLKIIVGSTRPTRKGHLVADWFSDIAKQHPEYEVEVLDLQEIDLPLMNEPEHPRLRQYIHDHTKSWSASIDEADAFVIVTPEYNYSFPATIKNALDYLSMEWQEKPVGFVSYGGMSGGMRAVQALKLPVTTLGMVPLAQAVNIPFFGEYINEEGHFIGNESFERSANTMLDKLKDWTEALKGMREKNLVKTV